jgi:tetratricopeptide (TPR) repeat protein
MEGDATSTTPAIQDMTAEASLSLADSFHVDENYSDAIDAYAAALSVVRESQVALHIRCLSHRSSAFYQLGRYEEALEDANFSLELLSNKGPSGLRTGEGELCHKRLGLAAFKLQRYTPAKEALQKAAQLASLNNRSDASYMEWIDQCDKQLAPAPSDEQKMPAKKTTPALATSSSSASSVPPASAPGTTPKPTVAAAAASVAPVAASSTRTAAVSTGRKPTMPKYQWWQNDNFLTISILESSVQLSDMNVTFEPKRLVVILRKGGVDFTVIAGYLCAKIDPEKSKVVIKDEKVLIKLKKCDLSYEWHELLGKADETEKATTTTTKTSASSGDTMEATEEIPIPTVKDSKRSAYSSHRDWDAIEKDLSEQEKQEKPEGDEAMNKLFQQIYKNASEETRRAMIKSYQTSGGTVLSTNWDEVGKTDYEKERTAPKGMEWKNWEGDKLPMKEDD